MIRSGSFLLSLDIDRLSLVEKGPDAFAEFLRAAAQLGDVALLLTVIPAKRSASRDP